jgi:DNA-binding transcriptional ArsR family regulator
MIDWAWPPAGGRDRTVMVNRLEIVAIRHPLRKQLLKALAEGKAIDLESYAKALDLSQPGVLYHCRVLVEAAAVEVNDGAATITESGSELNRIAQKPDRRQHGDRRRGDRRQG